MRGCGDFSEHFPTQQSELPDMPYIGICIIIRLVSIGTPRPRFKVCRKKLFAVDMYLLGSQITGAFANKDRIFRNQ